MKFSTVFVTLWVASLAIGAHSQCLDIPSGGKADNFTSVCKGLLGYSQGIPFGGCTGNSESIMQLIAAFSPSASLACSNAMQFYACSRLYPECTYMMYGPPNTDVCDRVTTQCSSENDQWVKTNVTNMINVKLAPFGQSWNFGLCNPGANLNFSALYQTNSSLATLQIGQCVPFTSTYCAGIVNYPVYVKSTTQLLQAEGTAKALIPFLSSVPKMCKQDFHVLICQTLFPECRTQQTAAALAPAGVNTVTTVPAFPDKARCSQVNSFSQGCGLHPLGIPWTALLTQALATAGFTGNFFNCTASTTVVGYGCSGTTPTLTYGRNYWDSFSVNGLGQVVTSIAAPASSPNTPTFCFPPLVEPNGPGDTIGDSSCALPCPNLLWDKGQYENDDVTMLVLSCFALVTSSLMVGTYAAFKKTRKKLATVYFTFCIWLVSLCLFFTVTVKNDLNDNGIFAGMQCENNTKMRYSGYCVFQAICMTFGGFGAVCWWCIQGVDLFLQLVFNAGKWTEQRKFYQNVVYYAWGWGYPLIVVIISGALGKLGNQANGIPYCFIIDSDLSYGIFYGPIAAMCVVGCSSMIAIIVIIFRSSEASGAHKKKGGYLIYVRPLIFIGAFLFVWIFIFAYRFYEAANTSKYTADGETLVKCLLYTKTLRSTTNCDVKPYANSGLYYMIQVVVSGVGLWGFLLYNTWENFVMWYHYLTCKAYNFSRTTGTNEDSSTHGSTRGGAMSKQGSRKNLKSSSSHNVKGTSTGSDDAPTGLRYGNAASSSSDAVNDTDVRFTSAGVPGTGAEPVNRTTTGLELGTVN